jgi:hypothetical protein
MQGLVTLDQSPGPAKAYFRIAYNTVLIDIWPG